MSTINNREAARAGNITEVTRGINPGLNGLEDRIAKTKVYLNNGTTALVGPAKVGPKKVGEGRVGTGNPALDALQRLNPFKRQSGGFISPGSSTTMRHTNFQQNQQVFNQSRGGGRRQVVVVRRRAPQQPMQLPTPAPAQGILPSGGVNNIVSINDMYSVVGMS